MPSIISDRSIIKISGLDSTKFLQNLVTNDVASMHHFKFDLKSIYAMMLSPQGRFLFDMFIMRLPDGYLLDIFLGTKDLFLKKIRMYNINMSVEIEDLEYLRIGYIPLEESSKFSAQNLTYKDPRYEKLGYRTILDSSIYKNDNSYLIDKYNHSIPDGGVDLLYDKSMPQEYGAEQLHAISYNKGCYIGQEVISRTKSQGIIRKRIYKVTADYDFSNIPHGSEITMDGSKIGVFCSGFMKEGIALIRDADYGVLDNDMNYRLNDSRVHLNLAKWYYITQLHHPLEKHT